MSPTLAEMFSKPEARRGLQQEKLMLEFGDLILNEMDDQRVSKAELARRIGCSRSHVTQMLSGYRNATLRSFAAMAHALGMEVEISMKPLEPLDRYEKEQQP